MQIDNTHPTPGMLVVFPTLDLLEVVETFSSHFTERDAVSLDRLACLGEMPLLASDLSLAALALA